MDLAFRIVNVFTVDDDPFSGNPLAVFEDATHLDGDQMQSLARQLNLSESTFVTGTGASAGPDGVDASVRIFTTDYEMPFAGHPTLGTAYVVAGLGGGERGGRPSVVLGMPAGRVTVSLAGGRWTFAAPAAPTGRPVDATAAELAAMVGLTVADLAGDAIWVDTGVEQLVLPLTSAASLRRASPDVTLLNRHGRSSLGESQIYLWAATGGESIEARMFFGQGSGVAEDPATGSACANLGGWFHLRGDRGIQRVVRQGDAVHRPSELHLAVEPDGAIRVGGSVIELGRGTITLP